MRASSCWLIETLTDTGGPLRWWPDEPAAPNRLALYTPTTAITTTATNTATTTTDSAITTAGLGFVIAVCDPRLLLLLLCCCLPPLIMIRRCCCCC